MIERNEARRVYLVESIEDDFKLYHYTTTLVLDLLLDSCTFRASNVFYLNDSEEYYAGIKNLREKTWNAKPEIHDLLDKLLVENGRGDLGPGIFSVSFSQEADLLSQWVTYAKEAGAAIEIDSRLIVDKDNERELRWYGVESFSKQDNDEYELNSLLFFQLKDNLHEIDYGKTYEPMTKDKISIGKQKTCKETYQYLASYYKDGDFKAENEVRLSVLPMCCGNGENKREAIIKYYRMGERGILRPYLDVTIGYRITKEEAGKKVYYFHPCLPIKTITIGPGGDQQMVFDSVVHRIRYGKTNVYNYMEDEVLLKENIYNYINEIIEWLLRKEYIKSIFSTCENAAQKYMSINEMIFGDNRIMKDDKDKVLRILNSIVLDLENTYHMNINFYRKLKDEDAKLSSLEKSILCEMKNDFFFTKEGILIKKSKIPYIF